MDINKILSKCDHTILSVTACWEDVKTVLDDAIKYKTASACIPPAFVKRAKDYVKDNLAICTVIGFPNGYNTTAVKVAETLDAVSSGADEIDMVINVGELKNGNYDYVLDEIKKVRDACQGKILKVIIETCLLTKEEKLLACKAVSTAGADYIKTSTGFSTGGATIDDVLLLRANVSKEVKVKASGGISGLKDGEDFINAGADRLGTSRIIKAVKEGAK